jgi:serine/threonine-protein kinase ATR
MKKMADRLPAYQFYSAFPQIISRICHENTAVFGVIEQIILSTLCTYPEQSLWHLVSVYKSTYPTRSSRCSTILTKAKSNSARGSRPMANVIHVRAPFDLSN